VAALAEEFYAGEGAGDRLRTIFAVGDAKQSIYSFQRADPRAFWPCVNISKDASATPSRNGAWCRWKSRSARPSRCCGAIDAVFRHEAARDGVALDGSEIRHIASRAGQAGVVELWPPVLGQLEEPPDSMALPVIRQRTTQPRTRLANAIAATIADWLVNGNCSKPPAVRFGQATSWCWCGGATSLSGELLRALKQRDIPVAGADRLVLIEQLAVQDLVALGRFLLLPRMILRLRRC